MIQHMYGKQNSFLRTVNVHQMGETIKSGLLSQNEKGKEMHLWFVDKAGFVWE